MVITSILVSRDWYLYNNLISQLAANIYKAIFPRYQ